MRLALASKNNLCLSEKHARSALFRATRLRWAAMLEATRFLFSIASPGRVVKIARQLYHPSFVAVNLSVTEANLVKPLTTYARLSSPGRRQD